jgi:L-arabinose isomerase
MGEGFAEERVDLIFCHAATYATSSQVLPAVQKAGVPSSSTSSQAPLGYENADTDERLANCSACCVPEISNAFERAAIPLNVVSGTLYDDEMRGPTVRLGKTNGRLRFTLPPAAFMNAWCETRRTTAPSAY